MSIEFAKSYKTSDGRCHGDLKEAQEHEIIILLKPTGDTTVVDVVKLIVSNSSQIVNILTMTERSRPKARGSKKPRKNRVTEPATTTAA